MDGEFLIFGHVGGPNKKIQKYPLGWIFLNQPKNRLFEKKYRISLCNERR